jgi:hypothetical protein
MQLVSSKIAETEADCNSRINDSCYEINSRKMISIGEGRGADVEGQIS